MAVDMACHINWVYEFGPDRAVRFRCTSGTFLAGSLQWIKKLQAGDSVWLLRSFHLAWPLEVWRLYKLRIANNPSFENADNDNLIPLFPL
jgi:hypothetical protein